MDTTISRKNQSFLWTGKVSGYDTTIWKAITGAPSLSSDKIRLNQAEITSFLALKNGDVEMGLTIPTAPTAGDARFFGISNATLDAKGKIGFIIEDDKIYCLANEDDGTSIFKVEISWATAYTAAEAIYRISWSANQIVFSINGTIVYQTSDPSLVKELPSLPNNITIKNENADNLDFSYLAVRNSAELNEKLISPGGGLSTSSKQDDQIALETTINASLDDIETVLEDVHDNPANLLRTAEQDPLNYAFGNEVLANVTNGADGTYYYYVDMDTFRKLGLMLELNGGSGTVTVTVEGSLQDDGTAPASCTYIDVSTAFGAASWTDSTILTDSLGFTGVHKYIRVKVVASTGAANDADWKITAKKLY